MLHPFRVVLIVAGLFLFGAGDLFAGIERVEREKSPFDVEIENVNNSDLTYLNAGWDENFTYETWAIIRFDKSNNRYLNLVANAVANDEFYWESAPAVTVGGIKRHEYFKDRTLRVTYESPGVNAGADTVAGEPSYLLFTADRQECAFLRRISALGEHGGTTVPHMISGYYCVPEGEHLTRDQARKIVEQGLIFNRERR